MSSIGGTQKMGSSGKLAASQTLGGSQRLGSAGKASQSLGGSKRPSTLGNTLGKSGSPSSKGGTQNIEDEATEQSSTKKNALMKSEGGRKLLARLNEATETYPKLNVNSQGKRCHHGRRTLRDSLEPRDTLKWHRDDKQFHPYSYFESASNVAKPKETKLAPPKMWLPKSTAEEKDEKKKAAKEAAKKAEEQEKNKGDDEDAELLAAAKAEKDKKKMPDLIVRLPGNTIDDRPAWIPEHNVMFSRMNSEVQTRCREYFDEPKRTEMDGVLKVRERYCMNDRQMGWNDEPSLLGEARRTYLDNLGEYNVVGPKCQQLPSYWRTINDWRAYSEPAFQNVPVPAINRFKNRNFLDALANTPADEAKKFWRTWAQTSINRLPKQVDDQPIGKKGKKKVKEQQAPAKTPLPEPTKHVFKHKVKPTGEEGWDNRWSVMHSKNNDELPVQERMFFRQVEYLNGNKLGYGQTKEKNRGPDPYAGVPYELK